MDKSPAFMKTGMSIEIRGRRSGYGKAWKKFPVVEDALINILEYIVTNNTQEISKIGFMGILFAI